MTIEIPPAERATELYADLLNKPGALLPILHRIQDRLGYVPNAYVPEVRKGQITAHVRLQLSGGEVVTAAITNEAVEDLQLAAGDQAAAVIKASDVMIGKD